MKYEVEQKHRIDTHTGTDIGTLLAGFGSKLGEPIFQSDQYFAHPSRDFAKTDEALRIRTEGNKSSVTYKGPKIDATTKTRQETELPLHPSDADGAAFRDLLLALGFEPVATVSKERRPFTIHFEGRDINGMYDLVDQLGPFVELELMADETELNDAKRIISNLAKKLDLGPSIRRSYLEMLLEKGL